MIDTAPVEKKVIINFKDKTTVEVTVDRVELRDGFFILHYPNDRQVYYHADSILSMDVSPA